LLYEVRELVREHSSRLGSVEWTCFVRDEHLAGARVRPCTDLRRDSGSLGIATYLGWSWIATEDPTNFSSYRLRCGLDGAIANRCAPRGLSWRRRRRRRRWQFDLDGFQRLDHFDGLDRGDVVLPFAALGRNRSVWKWCTEAETAGFCERPLSAWLVGVAAPVRQTDVISFQPSREPLRQVGTKFTQVTASALCEQRCEDRWRELLGNLVVTRHGARKSRRLGYFLVLVVLDVLERTGVTRQVDIGATARANGRPARRGNVRKFRRRRWLVLLGRRSDRALRLVHRPRQTNHDPARRAG
jgi:hypothetical protein